MRLILALWLFLRLTWKYLLSKLLGKNEMLIWDLVVVFEFINDLFNELKNVTLFLFVWVLLWFLCLSILDCCFFLLLIDFDFLLSRKIEIGKQREEFFIVGKRKFRNKRFVQIFHIVRLWIILGLVFFFYLVEKLDMSIYLMKILNNLKNRFGLIFT